ncbi:MAG TPA: hypothetical protein VKP64_00995, partial [Mycobacteriales bacterium]|nr:hypothetical protein [Mycobacteriales bacterium]
MAGLTARDAVPPGADAVFVPSSRPDVLVREVVDELLRADGGALRYEAPRGAPDPGKRRTTFREAVAEIVRFTRSALAMFLNRLRMRLLRQAERTLTDLTYGARGSGEVRLVPERGDALVNAAQRTIEDLRRSARAGLGTSRSGLIVPATPQLWAAVRGGVLGLLDGEMPVPFQSPRQGTRREIILDRGR